MSEPVSITPVGPFDVALRPPGSKSLTNRALLLAALANGESILTGVLDADDTRHMLDALRRIGIDLTIDDRGDDGLEAKVQGCDGRFPGQQASDIQVHIGNAGTAIRFLCAACCLGSGRYVLDGIPRMRERPIGQLVDALRQIGAGITYLGNEGFAPLRVDGGRLTGGDVSMPAALSSQYISAMLQIAPYCANGLTLRFDAPIPSKPYVRMTLALMERFGITAQVDPHWRQIRVEPGRYVGAAYPVEPDASNASYFLAAAAVVFGGKCTIEGLGRASIQGDVGFADVLAKMGADLVFGNDFITVMAPPAGHPLRGIDVDLNTMPDMAQTLAVVALFAHGPTTIRNVASLRIKETDRMHALKTELTKLGAHVQIDGDDLRITPPPDRKLLPAAIDTYDDHRMAMSFAVAGLATPGIIINDPDCVQKTFPRYFDYLCRLDVPPPPPAVG